MAADAAVDLAALRDGRLLRGRQQEPPAAPPAPPAAPPAQAAPQAEHDPWAVEDPWGWQGDANARQQVPLRQDVAVQRAPDHNAPAPMQPAAETPAPQAPAPTQHAAETPAPQAAPQQQAATDGHSDTAAPRDDAPGHAAAAGADSAAGAGMQLGCSTCKKSMPCQAFSYKQQHASDETRTCRRCQEHADHMSCFYKCNYCWRVKPKGDYYNQWKDWKTPVCRECCDKSDIEDRKYIKCTVCHKELSDYRFPHLRRWVENMAKFGALEVCQLCMAKAGCDMYRREYRYREVGVAQAEGRTEAASTTRSTPPQDSSGRDDARGGAQLPLDRPGRDNMLAELDRMMTQLQGMRMFLAGLSFSQQY